MVSKYKEELEIGMSQAAKDYYQLGAENILADVLQLLDDLAEDVEVALSPPEKGSCWNF